MMEWIIQTKHKNGHALKIIQKKKSMKIIKKFLNLVKEIVLGNRLGKFPVPGQPQTFESSLGKR